jgi:hypothetical protein
MFYNNDLPHNSFLGFIAILTSVADLEPDPDLFVGSGRLGPNPVPDPSPRLPKLTNFYTFLR